MIDLFIPLRESSGTMGKEGLVFYTFISVRKLFLFSSFKRIFTKYTKSMGIMS